MKPGTILALLVVLLLASGASWARGFGGGMGVARSAGTGGQTTVVHSSAGQVHQSQQVTNSRGQIVGQSFAPSLRGHAAGAFAAPRFATHVATVPVQGVPVFFPHHFPFFRHPGILIVDVPPLEVTTVTTTEFAPSAQWRQPPLGGSRPPDSRLRGPGQLAPFDPTPQEVAERMLALAGVKKGDVVYDPGSGDGRIVIAAAKKYGVKAVGFEIDPGLVKLARENIRKQGVEKLVEIRQQDFMTADFSHATVVILYLSYDGNLALQPRLMNQLKPGARVVSNTFDMGDWQPKITEAYRDAAGDTHLLYYWQISAPELYGDNSPEKSLPTNQSGAAQRLSFVAAD